ncbi:clan AA aspartic protease [Mucilaginibacter sp. PPCGB 2223]|uniref:aspartyl protease family protein n=1 Tax=Mucilaginibacter sp. PPCGB 2223 TaxID=1886027 RepID=UPI000824FF47|nr:aspartyl protease family protein [Mucilaginibacter sp. PPCGB 2223]OCX51654.1 clan AA aspartic protease [Mucilaginibacter sp. PPCGB 2223]
MTISIPLQIIDLEGDGFHPLVEVVVFGKPFLVVLDTGASKTAFDKNMLLETNAAAVLMETDKLSTGLGTSTMASFRLTLDELYVGGFRMPDAEVAVLDLSTINNAYSQLGKPLVLGVLGGDILMRYRAVIDYGEGVLTLNT